MLVTTRHASRPGAAVGNFLETSNETLFRPREAIMVGTFCLMSGMVCRLAAPVGAATMPAGSIPFGKYVKVGSNDYVTGHELACQLGSDWCGDNSYWSTSEQTCQGLVSTNVLDGLPMQNFTASMCDAFATPADTAGFTSVGTLVDERDGKSYLVRKYADGHCWMAQNLAFGTSLNSSDFFTNCGKVVQDMLADGLYGVAHDAAPYDGYYYNWLAVTQDQMVYSDNTYQPAEPLQGPCQAGWHVPSASEFRELMHAVDQEHFSATSDSQTNASSPGYAFVGSSAWVPLGGHLSGWYQSDSAQWGQGIHGYWSSSTDSPNTNNRFYTLHFGAGTFVDQNGTTNGGYYLT
ncbi:hypothetical protein IJJ12_00640, partial [bacterium]|nr:hypothetical protein [bacterium]